MRHTHYLSFISWPVIIIFYIFIQSGQNHCYYFNSCTNSSNKCRLRPGCCQQFNQQRSKSRTQRFPPLFFSPFVTAPGQRLMNNINLDKRPRRVFSFFSFSLNVLLFYFTASLLLSFIHAYFLTSPSRSFFLFPPVLLSFSFSLVRSVPVPFFLRLCLFSCVSSFFVLFYILSSYCPFSSLP